MYKFRVGIVTMWFVRGIGIIAQAISNNLEEHGIETHIFSRWESHRQGSIGDMHHESVLYAGDDPSPDTFTKWVNDKELDAVIFTEYHSRDVKRAEALKDSGVPMLCLEMMDIFQTQRLQDYDIFDSLLSVNEFGRRFWETHFPRKPNSRIHILKRPVLTPDDITINNPLRFMHIAGWGGVNFRKNTDIIINTFDKLLNKNKARLMVHSQLPFNKYPGDLVKIIEGNENIEFHGGTVASQDMMYKSTDVYVGPSKCEGYGLPHEESLRHGLALICSDAPIQRDWVSRNGITIPCDLQDRPGMLIPDAIINERELLVAMEWCIKNPDSALEMKKESASDYIAMYGEVMVGSLACTIEQVIEG